MPGTVIVMLIVEKDSSVSNLKVLHSFSTEQDELVLKVFKKLSKWTPGLKGGKPVRVLCSVHINFKIKILSISFFTGCRLYYAKKI
jgi:hypothetical protein